MIFTLSYLSKVFYCNVFNKCKKINAVYFIENKTNIASCESLKTDLELINTAVLKKNTAYFATYRFQV